MMKTTVAPSVILLVLSTIFCSSPALADALEGVLSPGEILEASSPSDWRKLNPENTLYIDLERGRIVVALSTQLAQRHVTQVKALAREGYYDGLSFYRVIDGFVAQGGDAFGKRPFKEAQKNMPPEFEQPLSDHISVTLQDDADGYASKIGWVDSLPVGIDDKANTVWHLHCTGAFAFGRNNETDSASTEFYITLQPQRYLDRNLTVFGRVVEGMEHFQMMRRAAPPESEDDDLGETILSMRVAADVPDDQRVNLEILDSSTETFAAYLEARRNRPSAFFYYRPDYVDICQFPVPVRAASQE
ncbi:MAG: peptidylprolyl isomerase [Alphaproteobacteria bacterium]|nr:peptidylprolyl isomerase [Alphaproteobacteria bacterium]